MSASDRQFNRPNAPANGFYYQTFYVKPKKNGTFTFTSTSAIDTFWYLYENSIGGPFDSIDHMVTSNENSAGERQFTITVNLTSTSRYFLLVKTYDANVTGSFSSSVSGPSSIGLGALTPAVSTHLLRDARQRDHDFSFPEWFGIRLKDIISSYELAKIWVVGMVLVVLMGVVCLRAFRQKKAAASNNFPNNIHRVLIGDRNQRIRCAVTNPMYAVYGNESPPRYESLSQLPGRPPADPHASSI